MRINRNVFTRNDVESFQENSIWFARLHNPENKAKLQLCLFVGLTLYGVCFVFSFCNNVIVMLI